MRHGVADEKGLKNIGGDDGVGSGGDCGGGDDNEVANGLFSVFFCSFSFCQEMGKRCTHIIIIIYQIEQQPQAIQRRRTDYYIYA